jgi:hypothetical protein
VLVGPGLDQLPASQVSITQLSGLSCTHSAPVLGSIDSRACPSTSRKIFTACQLGAYGNAGAGN